MRVLLTIILAGLVGTCSSPPPLLDQVLETGELRVVTRNSATAYTVSPDGPMGPEYDLVRAFADELGVTLVIDAVDSVSEIMPKLLSGDAHMAAAGLSVTDSRREYVHFGHPYESVDVLLVYKLGTGKPRSIDDILDRSLEVMAATSHVDILELIKEDYPELTWVENADIEAAGLLEKVAEGDVELTVADSPDFNIQRHFYPDLRIALDLEVEDQIAWAFPKNSGDTLLARADEFIIAADHSGMLARVHDRYYGHTKKYDYVGTRNFIRHYETRLPRYRAMFEQAGEEWGVDWRLLAAIGYQESHWDPNAVSPTGVRGIMMLTKAAMKQLDMSGDRIDFFYLGGQLREVVIVGAGRMEDAAPDSLAEIYQGLEPSLSYLKTSGEAEGIDRIVLSGGGAKLPGLREYLASCYDVPSELADPLSSLDYDPELFGDHVPEELTTMLTVGVGLALRKAVEV